MRAAPLPLQAAGRPMPLAGASGSAKTQPLEHQRCARSNHTLLRTAHADGRSDSALDDRRYSVRACSVRRCGASNSPQPASWQDTAHAAERRCPVPAAARQGALPCPHMVVMSYAPSVAEGGARCVVVRAPRPQRPALALVAAAHRQRLCVARDWHAATAGRAGRGSRNGGLAQPPQQSRLSAATATICPRRQRQ